MINTLLGHSIYTLTSATATAEMRGVVRSLSVFAICASLLSGCLSTAYEGIALSEPARVTVKYDMKLVIEQRNVPNIQSLMCEYFTEN